GVVAIRPSLTTVRSGKPPQKRIDNDQCEGLGLGGRGQTPTPGAPVAWRGVTPPPPVTQDLPDA
ncbi:MAG: hypothetical protein ACKOJF_13465, partial [Planctomycetaceae bacterium]